MKIQDSVLGFLSPLSDEDVGSVLQPSAQPITKEGTLTKAIHEIGLSKAPQPVIPTPFFKTAAVSDFFGSLRVRGSSLTSHPKTFYPMCKRAAFTPPPVDPYHVSPIAQYPVVPLPVAHQIAAPHAVDPIISVLKKFKIALTSFKRN